MIAPALASPRAGQTRHTPAGATDVKVLETPAWHDRFLQLLPAIRRRAAYCFRMADGASREEAIQEIVASSLVAYARLVELGKEDVAYAGTLANFAIAQFHAGRRVGCRLNANDVTSEYCQARKCLTVESLHQQTDVSGVWREALVEDQRANPADLAALRIDFDEWLTTLSPRNRRLAERLATGETTSEVAREFRLSQGRISQLRAELYDAWQLFQSELAPSRTLACESHCFLRSTAGK